MAVIYISGEINKDLVNQFLTQLNKVNKTEPVTVYLNSDGGYTADAQAIIDVINTNKTRITLIACGEIGSAAFNIFFEVNCKRRIIEDTTGMAHFSWASFELNEAGEPTTDEDRFLMNVMKSSKTKTIQRFREIGLNKHEIGKIRANKEVYFTYERLNELLNGKTT